MTREELIMLNQDINETIEYARHKLAVFPRPDQQTHGDIWRMLERTNENMQKILNCILEKQ